MATLTFYHLPLYPKHHLCNLKCNSDLAQCFSHPIALPKQRVDLICPTCHCDPASNSCELCCSRIFSLYVGQCFTIFSLQCVLHKCKTGLALTRKKRLTFLANTKGMKTHGNLKMYYSSVIVVMIFRNVFSFSLV